MDRFLLFGRNLLQQSSGEAVGGYGSDVFKWRNGANNSLAPDESDEVALEFLHKHAGDLSRAQFHMTSQVSGGAGAKEVARRRNLAHVFRTCRVAFSGLERCCLNRVEN